MSLFNFVKKLLPRIQRSVVVEDLRVTDKELASIIEPSWQAAGVYFKLNKPESKALKNMETLYYTHCKVRGPKQPTFINDIALRLTNLRTNLTYIQNNIDKVVDKDILAEGMTAKAAFMVRSTGHIALLSRYLGSLLNFIYTVEAEHLDQHLNPELQISKSERIYIDRNFENFCKMMSKYTADPKDWEATVERMPEIYMGSANEQGAVGFYKGMEVDPLEQVGLSGFVGTAIYSVRMVFARWQQDRYDSAVAKKQQLELRLLYLQMRQQNEEGDATLENEIRILQDRIENLDNRIREEEEKYGVFK